MYIPRHAETVVQRISKRKPVIVLTGARQVGKSTILKALYPSLHVANMSSPLARQAAKDNPSSFFDIYKPPVVVDEIQKVGELFDYIKERVDEAKVPGQYYLTGSQSLALMQNVSESLAGRAGIIKMLGLSCRELDGVEYTEPFVPTQEHASAMLAHGATFDHGKTTMRIHTGFFPELYETESDLAYWDNYYDSYLATYIEKDIRDMLNIQDESAFLKFMRAAASLSGQMLNMSHIADACGKDDKTVSRWLSVLQSSGLVYLLEPYHNNFSKRLVKRPKLYFLDTGLACWLLGWNTPEQLVRGAMWGHIFETFVVGEILKSYYNAGKYHPMLFYYRDKDKREIDILIQEGETLYPVEIKATSDPKQSMISSFGMIDKVPNMKRGPGAIVCMAKERYPLTEKDMILPVSLI
jgi:predicted AAA+ superfamily ATPase